MEIFEWESNVFKMSFWPHWKITVVLKDGTRETVKRFSQPKQEAGMVYLLFAQRNPKSKEV